MSLLRRGGRERLRKEKMLELLEIIFSMALIFGD